MQSETYRKETESLQKDNDQLRVKITYLLSELDEVNNERELLEQRYDTILQTKQIAQQAADSSRALEVINVPSTCICRFTSQHLGIIVLIIIVVRCVR